MPEFDYDVFLSHAHADKKRVRPIAERLRDAGLRVWYDGWEIKPGDSILLKVEHGLARSRVLVLMLTPAAIDPAREWIDLERGIALFRDPTNRQRRFVPVKLEECNLPDTIRQYRYIDWTIDDAEALTELIEACSALGALVNALSTDQSKAQSIQAAKAAQLEV
jgi:hypothetical protein